MRRPRADIRGERGFTFVEVLIASVITLLVTTAVFYFVKVSGTQTQQIQAQLPAEMVSAADHAVAAGRDVNITASGGGIAAGVIHGNVAPPNPTQTGSANG